jgi:hypothetical protein
MEQKSITYRLSMTPEENKSIDAFCDEKGFKKIAFFSNAVLQNLSSLDPADFIKPEENFVYSRLNERGLQMLDEYCKKNGITEGRSKGSRNEIVMRCVRLYLAQLKINGDDSTL